MIEDAADQGPEAWARALGIARGALDLYLASDVIDLHVDSFIWRRLFGYALARRPRRGLLNGWFYSQCDLPRIRSARLSGALWIITTNPLRSRRGKRDALLANFSRLSAELGASPEVELVTSVAQYRACRARGAHAAF